ncbi:hypothetical protein [Streptococcus thoraltensis]|uniref:hypothetical protein n=1 Tax=Streptococcus thoraltensis TaxID=55085 RepID=UPI001F59BBA0|nr:hypothetical protein [Streptococcus thoraltensis]
MGEKSKKSQVSFDQLATQLAQDYFTRRLRSSKRRYRWFIASVTLVLGVLVLVFALKLYKNRDLSEQALRKHVQEYVASKSSDFRFQWTEQRVEKLVAKNSPKSTTLATIYQKYGKATDAKVIPEEASADGFRLIYQENYFDKSLPYQMVELSFKKIDGDFRLFAKKAQLKMTTYQSDWGHVFNLTQEDIADLKTGYMGVDASNYPTAQAILAQFGKPNSIDYNLSELNSDMHWYYYHPEAETWHSDDYVVMAFQKQPEDQDYHLSMITAVFDGVKVRK